ncbi:MAG: hypothetical protein ACRDBO_21840 [Lachnospiraceae bacterium]
MEQWMWIFIIVVMILSLIGSSFIVAYIVKKGREYDAENGINRPKAGASKVATTQGRRWNRIITVYLFLCLIFIVIILCQRVKGINREVFDCLAVPVGAIFFLIQAFSTRNTAIRRERATTYTMGTSVKRHKNPIFEFSAQGMTCKVRYAGRFNNEKGTQAELYYAPDDPAVVYIPEMENAESKVGPAILFIYGIMFPLLGLLAPLFR